MSLTVDDGVGAVGAFCASDGLGIAAVEGNVTFCEVNPGGDVMVMAIPLLRSPELLRSAKTNGPEPGDVGENSLILRVRLSRFDSASATRLPLNYRPGGQCEGVVLRTLRSEYFKDPPGHNFSGCTCTQAQSSLS